jgi:1-acyl-sn-glycerol-3-phosphate acyltransferase
MTEASAASSSVLVFLARVLLSVVGWTYLLVSSAILFPFALVIWLVTLPFDRNLVVQHLFTCAWAAMYIKVYPGWRLRIEGREKLPWKGAAILVANHQSLIDALVGFALFRPFKPVSQAAVRWAPFIGWNMMMNRYIALQRGERRSIAQMARDCRYWLRRGMPVMIYPEGTRSPDGEIKEFKSGAFALAVEENCPVYPIVITGTAGALPKKGLLLGLRARMHARVLDPVHPGGGEQGSGSRRERDRVLQLRDGVRQIMIRELARLRAEISASTSPVPTAAADARIPSRKG